MRVLFPDSLIARTAADAVPIVRDDVLRARAEYLGAVGVRRTRHAVPAGLIADLVAAIAQW